LHKGWFLTVLAEAVNTFETVQLALIPSGKREEDQVTHKHRFLGEEV
jgi:hypothetical protein